eukprot:352421-Chlamydomonas_euryale.AAC.21
MARGYVQESDSELQGSLDMFKNEINASAAAGTLSVMINTIHTNRVPKHHEKTWPYITGFPHKAHAAVTMHDGSIRFAIPWVVASPRVGSMPSWAASSSNGANSARGGAPAANTSRTRSSYAMSRNATKRRAASSSVGPNTGTPDMYIVQNVRHSAR